MRLRFIAHSINVFTYHLSGVRKPERYRLFVTFLLLSSLYKAENNLGKLSHVHLRWVQSSFSRSSLSALVIILAKFSLHYLKSLSSSFPSPCHLKFFHRTRSYHWCRMVRVS